MSERLLPTSNQSDSASENVGSAKKNHKNKINDVIKPRPKQNSDQTPVNSKNESKETKVSDETPDKALAKQKKSDNPAQVQDIDKGHNKQKKSYYIFKPRPHQASDATPVKSKNEAARAENFDEILGNRTGQWRQKSMINKTTASQNWHLKYF